MIFDFIKNLFSKEEIVIDFCKKTEDLNYFFKPLNKRANFNHGLIACFNSSDENIEKFIKKYRDEANSNGVIDKDYLDTIPQDKKLMKEMDKMMDEVEEYRSGLFFLKLFATIDYNVLEGILSYASVMLLNFAIEYQNATRPGDSYTYMNEGWYIIGQYFQKYYKILQLIPKAKRSKYPLKFLYYGRPTISAFLFFYILVKNYCDVVIVAPKDYDYKKAVYPFIRNWIKYNTLIDSFERR